MLKDGENGVDGLNGAQSVTVSPAGKYVYTASDYHSAVAVFTRNSSTGALTFVKMLKDGVGEIDGLLDARSVTVSPDGKHLYAAGNDDNALAVFESYYISPTVILDISSAELQSGLNAVPVGTVSGGVGPFTSQINWGDGTTETSNVDGPGVGGKHTYLATGSYIATITVTDQGGQQASDSIIFNVTGANATVAIPALGGWGATLMAASLALLFLWRRTRRKRAS